MPPQQQGDLPSWGEFVRNLTSVNISSLPVEEACIICHQQFHDTLDGLRDAVDPRTLEMLEKLPFFYPLAPMDDFPVRLPCPSGHILGISCLEKWFKSSGHNTCIQCMKPLFLKGTAPVPMPRGVRRRQAEYRISRLPLRSLLIDYRTLTDNQCVRFDYSEVDRYRIVQLMTDVAARLDGREVTAGSMFPALSRFLREPDQYSEREAESHDHTRFYREQMANIAETCSIEIYGRYSLRRVVLNSPEAEIMFRTLVECSQECLNTRRCLTPINCSNHMIEAVTMRWRSECGIRWPATLFLHLTVKAWVAHWRMTTEVRHELETDDESQSEDGDPTLDHLSEDAEDIHNERLIEEDGTRDDRNSEYMFRIAANAGW